MRKLRSSVVLLATICAIIVLALTVSAVINGSSLRLLSHGPMSPPDDDTNGGNIVAHGPMSPPDDDTNGGNIIGHGPMSPPDDDTNGGNIRLV